MILSEHFGAMKYFGIHIVIFLMICYWQIASSQFDVNYDPKQQPIDEIQYFKPVEHDLFVGDCMPFSHDGTLYMYWLIDKGHHSALNGYGAHQWVLSTSDNLINWKHYPIALGLDEEWEKSICTGSVIYAEESFYAFFATRSVRNGQRHEEMSFAVSDDGKDFEKLQPNPFFTAPEGYESGHFRDPKAIEDDDGYRLNFSSNHQRVDLGNVFIESVEGLNNNISLDIIMKGDIIDVSIDNRRCIVNRCHEEKENQLWFYAKHGIVNFKSIKVYEIKN